MKNFDSNEKQIKLTLESIMKDQIPQEIDHQMDRALDSFQDYLADHPCYKNRFSEWISSCFQGWNLAWSGSFGILLLSVIILTMFSNQSPTWADVIQKFKAISFFHATVHIRHVETDRAFEYEFWMGSGGKFRLHYGTKVIFADQDGIQKAFNAKTKETINPHEYLVGVINYINKADHFSFETVVYSLTGEISKLNPIPNQVEEVSSDLLVFDLKSIEKKEYAILRALKESRLPVSLKIVNWEEEIISNISFSYQREKSENFFDPQIFETNLDNPDLDLLELLIFSSQLRQ